MRFPPPLIAALFSLFPISSLSGHVGIGIDEHPAAEVAFNYVLYSITQDWTRAASVIEPRSLRNLRDRYAARQKIAAAEENWDGLIPGLDAKQIRKMDPAAFFAMKRPLAKPDFAFDDRKLRAIARSLKMRVVDR